MLFCWEDGRPPLPDTITARFNRLAGAAGLPRIRLHNVRHRYATVGQMSRVASDATFGKIGERLLPATSPFGADQGRLVEASSHAS